MATKQAASSNGKATTKPAPADVLDTEEPAAQYIPSLQAKRMEVPIIGTAPLIVHRWSDKAKRQMLDAQQGKKKPKENRDPQADYEASMYRLPPDSHGISGHGFPTLGFKAAIVSAARFYGRDISMVKLRLSIFMHGIAYNGDILTRISGEPHMREDMVRVGMGGTDLRYRAEYEHWTAVLSLVYIPTMLDGNSVLSLINAGGMGVGVGEWRPEKSGQNGTFEVDTSKHVLMS